MYGVLFFDTQASASLCDSYIQKICVTVFGAHFCYFFGLTALITLKCVTQLTFIPFITTICK